MLEQLFSSNGSRQQAAACDGEAIIDMNGVEKVYHTPAGAFVALRGIDLLVREGEFVSVVGKSGSGKSTLINMFTGIDHPTAGQVVVAGTCLDRLSEGEIAEWRGQYLGIVFQFFQLLPTLTVVENVMMPMDLAGRIPEGERYERALHLLETVGVADSAHAFPSAIAGGQQQRAAIARALANDPPILVADEPTGNLESSAAESIFGLFNDLAAQGKTIVMVTHDAQLARRVPRMITLSDGKIVANNAAEEAAVTP
jgi:putative ABC transport system ATP-binding protein